MKRINFILSIVLVTISVRTLAQQKNYTLPQVVPKSPDVAAFDKYGDIPVSLSTGTTNVSIPLLDIALGNFSLPITLSYHSNGLKVDDIPSSIGLGWSLQAGGEISYQQRGLDDFKPGGMLSGGATDVNKFFSGTMTNDQRYTYLEGIMNGDEDSEYDLYHYNFIGQVGSFYFDNTQQPVLMPKSDLKVSKTDNGFKIIDISGNQFYFETHEIAQMYSALEIEVRPGFNDVSAYYLSKITTRDNRTVNFKYKSFYIQYNKTNQIIAHYPTQPNPSCPNSSYDYFDTFVYQEYLLPDSILFDQGYIKFIHSTATRADLNKLNANVPSINGFYMANTSNQKLKEFSFTQGYFGDNDRLKLLSVQEVKGTTVNKKWGLGYYETGGFPAFFSKSKDHWGYANGAQNYSLIPDVRYSSFIANWRTYPVQYANRTSNFNASISGMLKEIDYPTGGSTLFEYEPNQLKVKSYQDLLSNPFLQLVDNTYFQVIAGASTLDDPDGDGEVSGSFTIPADGLAKIRAFQELDPTHLEDPIIQFTGPSEGIAHLYHAFIANCTTDHCQLEIMETMPAGTYTYRLVTGRWWNPATGSYFTRHLNFDIAIEKQGAPIPYIIGGNRIASITTNDNTGVTPSVNKKFIYNDSLQFVAFRNIPWYMTIKNKGIVGSGSLYCIDCGTEYDIHDESVIPAAGNLIEYQFVTEYDSSQTKLLGKTEHTFMLSINDAGSNSQPHVAPVNTGWRTGTIQNDKIYKTVDNNPQLTQEIQNIYTGTLSTGGSNRITGIKVDYNSYCTMSSPLSRSHNVSLSTLFTEQYYLSESKKIDYLAPQSIISKYNIAANSTFHTQPVLNDKSDSKNQTLREKTVYSFDYNTTTATSVEALGIKFLKTLNIIAPIEILQIKNIAGTDYVIGGVIYCYKSDKPVIENVFNLKIDVPVLLSTFVQSSINNGNLVKDSRYELRATFEQYDEYNNVLLQRASDNIPVSYLWDYKKLYPIAEVTNAVPTDIAYTSFEAEQKGNWMFSGTTVTDATSPTGTKAYNLTTGIISKSGLQSTKSYVLSYWIKGTTPYSITGTQTGYPLKGRTVNGWTNYVHKLSGIGTITFPANGYIDELRLYPEEAQMTTYSYREHIGVASSVNSQNQISYYEYDDFNRLKLIRDQDGKILKQYDYQFQKPITQ